MPSPSLKFQSEKMEELLRSVLLYSLLVSASLASHALSPLQSDAEALISFRRTIERDPHGVLQNWGSDNPCFWTGVNCSEGRVVALDLSNAGLVGFLQLDLLMTVDNLRSVLLQGNGFYGNLSSIKTPSPCSFVVVDLSDNNFTANIPAGFLLPCTQLVSLNLSNNFITGGIYPYSPSVQVLDLSQNQFSDNALLNYSFSNCQNLTFFNFSGNKLAGHLDSGISSCKNLVMLDLSYNLISEQLRENFLVRYCVPENCSMVGALQVLNLSHNNISGEFSDLNFGDCGSVRVLDLSYNGFSGKFPATLKNCQQLEILDLSGNSLGPEVPTLLGNLRSLHHLSLRKNHFYGEIPPELGHTCGTLKKLDLSYNNITGNIPSIFTSCSSLQYLDLRNNQFSGELLSGVISTITSLRYLCLSFNNITGTVPLSLSNFTKLEVLDLSSNSFKGTIPSGFCSGLSALQKIFLASNFLLGSVPSELGKCKNLRTVDFSFNLLSGPVPPEIWALPELNDLVLWANNIDGMIPDTLCDNGQSLQTLILNNNFIKGAIPSTLASCTNLTWLSLANNQLTGPIPPGIGKLEKLAIVQLFNNSLTGNIPPELGNCRSMIWLDLNSNNLTGLLPPELAKQTGHIVAGAVSGKEFAFVRNEGGTSCRGAGGLLEFAGIRPGRLETYSMMLACPNTRIYVGTAVYMFNDSGSMIFLDLAYNSLSGTIPEAFGSMAYLQVFNLGHNRFTGTIPDSFGGLKAIGALDLSYNELHGGIPGSLGGLSFLSDLDVSNNNLSGPIPSSGQLMTFPASRYANNSGLCGIPLPACGSRSGSMTGGSSSGSNSGRRKRSLAVGAVIGIAVSLFIIIGLSFALWKMQRQQKQEDLRDKYIESLPTSGTSSWKICGVPEPLSINVATFERPLRKLTFAHLLEATNGFSAESLIGSGGFGEVYKAQLKDGCTVAIKKLIQVTGQGDREFTAEMETIGKIKHRNLVPLLGYCKVGEERLLVYEYMKWGSLDMVLHDRTKRIARLDWAARKKIAIGSARGLAFLHHSCIPHIIHRDMKSSNVLLDENLEARVSDFGMARLVNALDTHLSVSTLAGTPGYVPPEYYQSFRCTTRGDVYSYGVILLELISGKKPIDTEEFGDNNLVGWAKQLVTDKKVNEIFDPELLHQDSDEAELYQYLKIACECLDERPLRRPTMIQVMAMFKELQIDSESDFLDGFSVGDTVINETSP